MKKRNKFKSQDDLLIIKEDANGLPKIAWHKEGRILFIVNIPFATAIRLYDFPFKRLEYRNNLHYRSHKKHSRFPEFAVRDQNGWEVARFIPALDLLLIEVQGSYTAVRIPDMIYNVITMPLDKNDDI